jgi:hypothetical protein
MKNIKQIRKTLALVILLIPTLLFAQDGLIINEEFPPNAQKLNLVFQTNEFLNVPIVLFNKTTTKVNLGNYGDGKIKKRTPSESTTKILGITYSETKFKFFIDFNNSINQTSGLTGTKTSSNILETTKAVITTNIENSRPWNFFLRIDKLDFLNVDLGRLTQGERTIKIFRTHARRFKSIDENDEINPDRVFYEFIEDDISLAAVTFGEENSIYLKPGLDATTKLILCTAMLSIAD